MANTTSPRFTTTQWLIIIIASIGLLFDTYELLMTPLVAAPAIAELLNVPLNNSLEYWTVLQRQQVPSRLVVFPDENHWILKGENSKVFYQEIHDWLARWLGPQAGTPR